MKARFTKYLTKTDNYLHVGCNVITPKSWTNIDASWNARLSRYPLTRKLLWKLRIISKEGAYCPWPKKTLIRDVNKDLSFPDNSIDGIYASHLLEHLSRSKARPFVRECYRICKAGGSKVCCS